MSEKILITGASGMLGRYVRFGAEQEGYDVLSPCRAEADLSDPTGLYAYVMKFKPTAILHLAAETDVDLCEREPRHAAICNGLATEALAKAARSCGAWFFYMSTSSVFGAENRTSYNELDLPNPLNYYGKSKLSGERAVHAWCDNNGMIVRGGWMIGGGNERDHKFVGKIVKQIKDGAGVIRAVGDRYGSITQAKGLAGYVIDALKRRKSGTFHFVSSGVASRFDIAREIAAYFNFTGDIVGVSSSLFPLSAPRPVFEVIESLRLDAEGMAPSIRGWRQDLEAYLRESWG